MKKKDKKEYISFTEDGIRFMQCKKCYNYIETSSDSIAVTCSLCVTITSIEKFPDTLPRDWTKTLTGRPSGWHWMKVFVDKEGNVFHKGKEQPKLKGTLPPTKVKPKKKKKKKKKKLSADNELFKLAAEHKQKQKDKRNN